MPATPRTLTLPAPAKLNRMRILGRRQDGYHELWMLLQIIDLCDYLSFNLRQDGVIELTTSMV